MATYTSTGGAIECTGTDITSAEILNQLDNVLSLGSGHFGETNGNKHTYFFNYPIRIGNSGSSGSSSIWDCSDEVITINATAFEIYGTVQQGTYTSSLSAAGGSFVVKMAANDTFRLYTNGIFRAYGSMVYASHRIRTGTDTEWTTIDCDLELEDGVSTGESSTSWGTNQDINYDDSRMHDTGAVGIKLYTFDSGGDVPTFSLNRTKVVNCTYAFQLADGANLAPVLQDVEIDSCTNHIVPNLDSDSEVTFINPDFTTLRASASAANDISRICFRYSLFVGDSTQTAVSGARVIIVDEASTEQVNSLTTAGGVVTTLPTYDSVEVLFNSTYAGTTKTNREDHVRAIGTYLYNPRVDAFTVNVDITDNVALVIDLLVTETTKATVDAYSTLDDAFELYDRDKAEFFDAYDSETSTVLSRSGAQIVLGAVDLVIDATAVAAYAYSATGDGTVTAKSTTFTGGAAATTGEVTLDNGATLSGGTFDCDVFLNSAQDFTNVTINGDLRIDTGANSTLDFTNVTVTGDVFNDAGSNTLQINSLGGSSLTAGDPGTGNGETNVVQTVPIKVTVKDITSSSLIQDARVYIKAGSGGDLPADDVVTITRVTTTATVAHTGHGMVTGEKIVILGALQNEYNGIKTITVTGANAYTYTVSGSPTTPATGTILATAMLVNELTDVFGEVNETHRFTNDQPVGGNVRKSSP